MKIDFVETFIKTDPYFENFFIKKNDNYFFDLTLFIESRFNLFGIYDIVNLGLCTYENLNYFFQIEGPIINLRETLVEWLQ